MIGDLQEGILALSKTATMEARVRRAGYPGQGTLSSSMEMKRDRDQRVYYRSFSNGNMGKKAMRSSYFSLEALFLLVCLTVSLLILPLILPPLPPPPFLLLLLPIAIFALLMILAFMPSNVKDLTCTYM